MNQLSRSITWRNAQENVRCFTQVDWTKKTELYRSLILESNEEIDKEVVLEKFAESLPLISEILWENCFLTVSSKNKGCFIAAYKGKYANDLGIRKDTKIPNGSIADKAITEWKNVHTCFGDTDKYPHIFSAKSKFDYPYEAMWVPIYFNWEVIGAIWLWKSIEKKLWLYNNFWDCISKIQKLSIELWSLNSATNVLSKWVSEVWNWWQDLKRSLDWTNKISTQLKMWERALNTLWINAAIEAGSLSWNIWGVFKTISKEIKTTSNIINEENQILTNHLKDLESNISSWLDIIEQLNKILNKDLSSINEFLTSNSKWFEDWIKSLQNSKNLLERTFFESQCSNTTNNIQFQSQREQKTSIPSLDLLKIYFWTHTKFRFLASCPYITQELLWKNNSIVLADKKNYLSISVGSKDSDLEINSWDIIPDASVTMRAVKSKKIEEAFRHEDDPTNRFHKSYFCQSMPINQNWELIWVVSKVYPVGPLIKIKEHVNNSIDKINHIWLQIETLVSNNKKIRNIIVTLKNIIENINNIIGEMQVSINTFKEKLSHLNSIRLQSRIESERSNLSWFKKVTQDIEEINQWLKNNIETLESDLKEKVSIVNNLLAKSEDLEKLLFWLDSNFSHMVELPKEVSKSFNEIISTIEWAYQDYV